MVTFYLIGALIAFVLGCKLIYKETDKKNLQYEMIIPLIVLSWISVVLILWKLRDKL